MKYFFYILIPIFIYVFAKFFFKKEITAVDNVVVDSSNLPYSLSYYMDIADDIERKFSGFSEDEQGIYDILLDLADEELKQLYISYGERLYIERIGYYTLRESVDSWFSGSMRVDALELIDNALNQ